MGVAHLPLQSGECTTAVVVNFSPNTNHNGGLCGEEESERIVGQAWQLGCRLTVTGSYRLNARAGALGTGDSDIVRGVLFQV